MNRERIIRLLDEQLRYANRQIGNLCAQLDKQSWQIENLTRQLERQAETIRSLEETLQSKESNIQKEKEGKAALAKMMKGNSEKQKPSPATEREDLKPPKPPVVRKGNNNAKRKEFFDLEEEEIDVYPDAENFDLLHGELLKTVDSIRYKVIPPRFIKQIYHVHTYKQQEGIFSGKAPVAPLLNSNYDSSILAYMIQLRYIYSLPIERMLKLFAEAGFHMKPT